MPREFPIQVFKMHNLAGLKYVLQNTYMQKLDRLMADKFFFNISKYTDAMSFFKEFMNHTNS